MTRVLWLLGIWIVGYLTLLFTLFLVWSLVYGCGEFSLMGAFWAWFGKKLVDSFGLTGAKPMRAVYAPVLFTVMFTLMFTGLLPYGTAYLHNPVTVLMYSYGFWFRTLLIVLSVKNFKSLVFHRHYGSVMAWVLLPIEVLRLVVRPLSLAIRLVCNTLFGHYALHYAFVLTSSPFLAPFSAILMGPLVLYEVFVCLVQAYVFTCLVVMYLEE